MINDMVSSELTVDFSRLLARLMDFDIGVILVKVLSNRPGISEIRVLEFDRLIRRRRLSLLAGHSLHDIPETFRIRPTIKGRDEILPLLAGGLAADPLDLALHIRERGILRAPDAKGVVFVFQSFGGAVDTWDEVLSAACRNVATSRGEDGLTKMFLPG